MYRVLSFLFAGLFWCGMPSLDAQSLHPEIKVKTRVIDGRVDIRWAPNDFLLFRLANRQGYQLQRQVPNTNSWQILLNRGPLSVEEFKARLDTNDVHVATAAQAVHGTMQAPSVGTDPLQVAKAIEEEQKMRYAFALLSADYSFSAARGLALGYRDEQIVPGNNYLYRIFIKDLSPTEAIDTTYFLVQTDQVYEPRKVEKVFAEEKDRAIVLKWPKAENEPYFSGYFVERSENGGKSFERLQDVPMLTSDSREFETFNQYFIYADRDLPSGQPFTYRVVGVTPFSDEGLPSDPLTAVALDGTGPAPISNLTGTDQGNGVIRINWDPSKQKEIAGYTVARSSSPLGPFYVVHTGLLDRKQSSYLDETPDPIGANYYLVYTHDEAGNKNGSPVAMVVWRDNKPPAQPQHLTGFIDSVGIVTLAWTWGSEPDLLGYRVLWSHHPNREFYPLSSEPVKGSLFIDSINMQTLTEKIYYKVIALDYNMNPSKPSQALELSRPDRIPPASPLLGSYRAFADSIQLQWQLSPSEDVVAYQLFRRVSEGAPFSPLTLLTNTQQTSWTDRKVAKGETYAYTLVAIEDAGLLSDQSPLLTVTALDGKKKPGVQDLTASIDEANASLILTWTYQASEAHQFVVFRSADNAPWQRVATLPSSQLSYTDSNLYQVEEGFAYRVQVLFENGASSGLSNRVELRLKP